MEAGIESNLYVVHIHMLKIICPIHLKGQLGTKLADFPAVFFHISRWY